MGPEVRIDIDDVLADQKLDGATGLGRCHWVVEQQDLGSVRRNKM